MRITKSAVACMLVWASVQVQAQTAPVSLNVLPVFHTKSFQITFEVSGLKRDTLSLIMPAWTPGYYQMLNFADNVTSISATDSRHRPLVVVKSGRHGWKVATRGAGWVQLTYEVSTSRTFVATPFVQDDRIYVSPPGVFLHIENELNRPAIVTLDLPKGWRIATGLDQIGKGRKYTATNFDVLYDSPILAGELEELPAFEVRGIPHKFMGFQLGEFDKVAFMNNLKKIVVAATDMMGDIPYSQYTFIAIGPGPGGIEHINSTSFGFSGESLHTSESALRMYAFLAHEYFHHYNVKRIRPVELGPFDYQRENRTHLLWVSEGFTVYYDLLLTYRAGLMTEDDLFSALSARISAYENKPGKEFQSVTEASYNTWSDGPFGRTGDEVNKTVSVYDKGAALGLLLDFAIRKVSSNAKSLDNVMRQLYQEFYQEKGRGFSEAEFKATCESVAGAPLTEIFDYANSTRSIDYRKYFSYGGLDIESKPSDVTGGWLGVSVRNKGDSLVTTGVDYQSPAWDAGIRRGMTIAKTTSSANIEPVMKSLKPGDQIDLVVGGKGLVTTKLGMKREATFTITKSNDPIPEAAKCLEQWLLR